MIVYYRIVLLRSFGTIRTDPGPDRPTAFVALALFHPCVVFGRLLALPYYLLWDMYVLRAQYLPPSTRWVNV